ncbi:CCDC130 [Cordylochernes scorpioides]|uniref:CCDC130 n=1 Tax=Cordylochernes scorpioides TaxID=51811 RepID=A0ABY6KVX6_9ARAC|nr:CCDC130 [Cordylochernes scorpioides]
MRRLGPQKLLQFLIFSGIHLQFDFPLRVKRCIAGLRILSVLFADDRPRIFKTDGWTCEICGTRMEPGLHHHLLSCMGLKDEREVLLNEIGLEGLSLELLLNENFPFKLLKGGFDDLCNMRPSVIVKENDLTLSIGSSTIGRWLDYREGASESILDWLVVKSATIRHVIHHRSGHPPQVRWLDYRKGISVSGSVLPRLKVASGSISTPRNHQRWDPPAERKAVNKYYPPEWTPSHGSINKFRGTHALRERARKLHLGILVIRFEMPYNIWCEGCNNHIGMGVRYNAEKSKVGMYYTTPIYKFRMKCHLCDNHFEIQTDPKGFPPENIPTLNLDYEILSGARRQERRWDPTENEQVVPEGHDNHDKEVSNRLCQDAMFQLEHGVEDKSVLKSAAPAIAEISEIQERMRDDYSLNQLLRKQFRAKKKELQKREEKDSLLPLDILLLPATEQDSNLAMVLKAEPTESPEFTLSTIQRVTGTQVSKMTINRRLRERNLRACRLLRCLPLTPVHRQVRLQWCRERSTWNCADWGRIVFSDESRFLLCPDDRRKCVWRHPGQHVDPGLTVEHHTGPQQGVMVWGAISFDSRTPLVVIPGILTAQ